jgi:hypothetical protein
VRGHSLVSRLTFFAENAPFSFLYRKNGLVRCGAGGRLHVAVAQESEVLLLAAETLGKLQIEAPTSEFRSHPPRDDFAHTMNLW